MSECGARRDQAEQGCAMSYVVNIIVTTLLLILCVQSIASPVPESVALTAHMARELGFELHTEVESGEPEVLLTIVKWPETDLNGCVPWRIQTFLIDPDSGDLELSGASFDNFEMTEKTSLLVYFQSSQYDMSIQVVYACDSLNEGRRATNYTIKSVKQFLSEQ